MKGTGKWRLKAPPFIGPVNLHPKTLVTCYIGPETFKQSLDIYEAVISRIQTYS